MPSSVKSNPSRKRGKPTLHRTNSHSTSNLYKPQTKQNKIKVPSNMILVATKYYNMSSHISEIFKRIAHYKTIYLLWLDCLYDINAKYEDVVKGLKPLINEKAITRVRKDELYIIGEEIDGKLLPSGYCVFFTDKNAKITSLIRKHKIHMSVMDKFWALRLDTSKMFVFGDGFPNFFADFDTILLEHAFSSLVLANTDVVTEPMSSTNSSPSNIFLTKFKSRDEAKTIVENYDENNDAFLRFHYESKSKPFSYTILELCFPDYVINYENIFLIHVKDGALVTRGVIGIKCDQDQKNRITLSGKQKIKLEINESILTFTKGSLQDFRSNVMNINQCYVYQVGNSNETTNSEQNRNNTTSTNSNSCTSTPSSELKSEIEPNQTKVMQAAVAKPGPSKSSTNSQQARKPSRIAATLGYNQAELDEMETEMLEKARKSQIVGDILDRMIKFGNTIIQIFHLPNELTFNAFKVMFGISSICSKQIIASDSGSFMNICLVLPSDSLDITTFLSKNGCKTHFNSVMKVKKIDRLDLEKFLNINADRLRKFNDDDDLIPRAPISYASHHTQV